LNAAATLRSVSWRWVSALALAAAALLAVALAQPPSTGSTATAPATSVPSPAVAPDPLTPAVAEIAWRDPRERIEVIAQFQPGVGKAAASQLVRENGGRITAEIGLINGLAAKIRAGDAARLARNPGLHAVSLNARVAGSGITPNGSELEVAPKELATSFNQAVRSPNVWYGGSNQATGKGVGVAVVDTGIQGDLPDFQGPDGASRVVAAVNTNPDVTNYGDGFGHGTHVAGLIAGNGEHREGELQGNYLGVAPDANLISVKISDDAGESTVLDAIIGLQFVVDHKDQFNIRVANLSLNSTLPESYRTDPLAAAAEQAWFNGIVVVAAAGNRGADADAVHYAPGNDPYVITVGASDDNGTKGIEDDALASWSSRGETQDGYSKPDLLAPGAHIVSTVPEGSAIAAECAECLRAGHYFQMGGTSMASAVASGIAALILEENPSWTPNEVKGAMENRLRNVPGVGGQALADKAVEAPSRALSSNASLTPSDLIDASTGNLAFDRLRWSRLRWSQVDSADRAAWSGDATFTRLRWSGELEEQLTEGEAAVETDRLRWSRLRWSRLRWSMSFSK